MNREEYLTRAVALLTPVLAQKDMPEVHVSTGWPSKGGTSSKKRAVGQCWVAEASEDGKPHIFISPFLGDTTEVLATLLHELIHAVCGAGVGHKGRFVEIAKEVGFTGPWTSTPVGEDLAPVLDKIAAELGDYPHSKLDPKQAPVKTQTTRMKKVQCPDCEYTVRTTQKWLEVGLPTCPCGQEMEEA